MSPNRSLWRLGLLLLAGCCCPVREQADRAICEMAAHPLDVAPLATPDQSAPGTAPYDSRVKPTSYQETSEPDAQDAKDSPPAGPKKCPPPHELVQDADRSEARSIVRQIWPSGYDLLTP